MHNPSYFSRDSTRFFLFFPPPKDYKKSVKNCVVAHMSPSQNSMNLGTVQAFFQVGGWRGRFPTRIFKYPNQKKTKSKSYTMKLRDLFNMHNPSYFSRDSTRFYLFFLPPLRL